MPEKRRGDWSPGGQAGSSQVSDALTQSRLLRVRMSTSHPLRGLGLPGETRQNPVQVGIPTRQDLPSARNVICTLIAPPPRPSSWEPGLALPGAKRVSGRCVESKGVSLQARGEASGHRSRSCRIHTGPSAKQLPHKDLLREGKGVTPESPRVQTRAPHHWGTRALHAGPGREASWGKEEPRRNPPPASRLTSAHLHNHHHRRKNPQKEV